MADVEFIDNSEEILRLLAWANRIAAEIIGSEVSKQAGEYVYAARGPKGNLWPDDVMTALKQSMTFAIEDDVLMVGSNMEVAPYIELGTGKFYSPSPEWIQYHGNDKHSTAGLDSWIYYDELEKKTKVGLPQHASPYLRPAFMDHVEDIKRTIEEEMKNAPE